LPHHLNNDLHRFPAEKGKGIAGTAIIHLVLFVLLILVGFSVPPPPESEKGILVNFGTDETGLGDIEPSPPASKEESAPPLPADVSVKTREKPLLTQNNEDAPEVKKVDPEAEKKRLERIETDRKRREEAEAERIRKETEDAEKKKVEAELKRQSDIINRTKNALANSKNAGTGSTSEGVAGGPGNQGVPGGSVDSKVRGEGSGTGNKGISYELGGRGVKSLPPPIYNYQEEGTVVVDVYVDNSGKVSQAIAGVQGSTTLNENLVKAARDAALKTLFEPKDNADSRQKGTITYHFKLK
jgi:TonB family protein